MVKEAVESFNQGQLPIFAHPLHRFRLKTYQEFHSLHQQSERHKHPRFRSKRSTTSESSESSNYHPGERGATPPVLVCHSTSSSSLIMRMLHIWLQVLSFPEEVARQSGPPLLSKRESKRPSNSKVVQSPPANLIRRMAGGTSGWPSCRTKLRPVDIGQLDLEPSRAVSARKSETSSQTRVRYIQRSGFAALAYMRQARTLLPTQRSPCQCFSMDQRALELKHALSSPMLSRKRTHILKCHLHDMPSGSS